MIYCSIEPGLFIMRGLAPHDNKKAFNVIQSLITHKKMMDHIKGNVPLTARFLEYIYAAFGDFPINDPPLLSEFKQYVLAILAKMGIPILSPAGVDNIVLSPDITSDWIDPEAKILWLESLTSAIIDVASDSNNQLVIGTWFRDDLPEIVQAVQSELNELIELPNSEWSIPLLTDELDWQKLFCVRHGWPEGLESTLLDYYAKWHLRIIQSNIGKRKMVRFVPSCLHDILGEPGKLIRESIIEVVACRAYDCVKPEHNDEKIRDQHGVRRVYVKKMSPPVRLHYILDKTEITYILYSNGDHDKGL